MEEECELVMQHSRGPVSATSMRMPPAFLVLPWRTHCGDFIFCVQSEDVAAKDVLGAACQVMTVRPRVVLTNSADCELELMLSKSKVLRLEPGQSSEHHWPAEHGDEEALTCTLRFRPLGAEECQWSSLAVCSDATAGSTPMILQTAEGRFVIIIYVYIYIYIYICICICMCVCKYMYMYIYIHIFTHTHISLSK